MFNQHPAPARPATCRGQLDARHRQSIDNVNDSLRRLLIYEIRLRDGRIREHEQADKKAGVTNQKIPETVASSSHTRHTLPGKNHFRIVGLPWLVTDHRAHFGW
jgi:hypothetical protein